MKKQWDDPEYVAHIKKTQKDYWASDAGKVARDKSNRNLTQKGEKVSEETRLKMKEAQANVPKETCPHCGMEGKRANMVRWHLSNCKKRG